MNSRICPPFRCFVASLFRSFKTVPRSCKPGTYLKVRKRVSLKPLSIVYGGVIWHNLIRPNIKPGVNGGELNMHEDAKQEDLAIHFLHSPVLKTK
jgi:hypothetical protein